MSHLKLTPKWCLDAALLSRPVDLTNLVTLSKTAPDQFIHDNVLHRLISSFLNEKNSLKADKDTKLDALHILANVCIASAACGDEVRAALVDISTWFDEYMAAEEHDIANATSDPELHKAMVLLLCRCWDYQLKTEDILELTCNNRRLALGTVVGLLEDGETYSTVLRQRQKPGAGRVGQWEHELVVNRYEKPLLLQICRLLRGFTHPGTYFDRNDGEYEIELYNIERFGEEMDSLLEISMRLRAVEKLSAALYDCLRFDDMMTSSYDASCDDKTSSPFHAISSSSSSMKPSSSVSSSSSSSANTMLSESDHLAVACVHAFLQNLYFYASRDVEEFRVHMLMDTLLIPRLVIPYLDKCVTQALILNGRVQVYEDLLEGDKIAQLALHHPQLVKGITSTLRTLIIASFRAPNTIYVMILLRKLNPTSLLLRATSFLTHHAYVFTLLCMLNVNMGALNLSSSSSPAAEDSHDYDKEYEGDSESAVILLQELERVYSQMSKATQQSIIDRVISSGALPLARDTPSYAAMMSMLLGGVARQFDYHHLKSSSSMISSSYPSSSSHHSPGKNKAKLSPNSETKMMRYDDDVHDDDDDDERLDDRRAEVKRESFERIKISSPTSSSSSVIKDDDHQHQYRLLGELPSLLTSSGQHQMMDIHRMNMMRLQLPTDMMMKKPTLITPKASSYHTSSSSSSYPSLLSSSSSSSAASSLLSSMIPPEFLCAINQHVMKVPMKGPYRIWYEKETIELWLRTRGSICPISHKPLTHDDLHVDDELRNRIKRYQIQQTVMRTTSNDGDDLYDF